MIDVGFILLQAASTVPQMAQGASQLATNPQPIFDVAGHGDKAIPLVKPITDLFRGRWGGSLEADPPPWFCPAVAFAVAIPVIALTMLVEGYDLTEPRYQAAILLVSCSVAMIGAVALTAIHNANRPSLSPAPPPGPAVGATASHVICHVCGAVVQVDQASPPISVAQSGPPAIPIQGGGVHGPELPPDTQ